MRKLLVGATSAFLLVALMPSAVVGMAGPPPLPPGCTFAAGKTTCITTTTITKEDDRVTGTRTESRQRPGVTILPCSVGSSHRSGTQSGVTTDVFLIATHTVYNVEYRRTTTTIYSGRGTNADNKDSETSVDVPTGNETVARTYDVETLVETTTVPTGKCRNTAGNQGGSNDRPAPPTTAPSPRALGVGSSTARFTGANQGGSNAAAPATPSSQPEQGGGSSTATLPGARLRAP